MAKQIKKLPECEEVLCQEVQVFCRKCSCFMLDLIWNGILRRGLEPAICRRYVQDGKILKLNDQVTKAWLITKSKGCSLSHEALGSIV